MANISGGQIIQADFIDDNNIKRTFDLKAEDVIFFRLLERIERAIRK